MLSDGFYLVETDGSYSPFGARFISRELDAGKPAKIRFEATTGTLQELEEIILVADGTHIFHGYLKTATDGGGIANCEAWSADWLLSWSYIPYYIFASGQSMTKVFADSATPFASGGLPAFGLWYMVQSIIPAGLFLSYNSTTVILPGARNSPIYGKTLRCCNNYPAYATDETGAATLSLAGSVNSMAENTYCYMGDDLYIKFGDGTYGAGAFLVFADRWLDRKIRSAVSDSRTATKDFDLQGKASDKISWLTDGLGFETQYLPHNDGYVYFSADDEISRGSLTSPIQSFVDGQNCRITLSSRTAPAIQAAVGMLENGVTTAKVDWDPKEIQLISVYDGKGDQKPEVDNQLDSLLADNTLPISVSFPSHDYFLRIGDYVRVSSDALGSQVLRISQIKNQDGSTVLKVGPKPFDTKKAFGELTRVQTDPDMDLLASKLITGGSASARTGTFTVKATDYAAGGWQCIYKEDFDEATDGTDVSRNGFIEILIGGVKIPPGRIKLESSVEVNLTDYCSVSASTNTSNSFARNIYNSTGWTPDDTTIVVEQYKGTSFV